MKKGVRSWLGWTRWNFVIAQTPLFIGVSYMQFSDDFTQLSENLGFKMDFEDILGIVAISTFLVGFSSVRLQSILEERKDGEARKIDRVLEQNAGKDLLPLPTSLGQMGTTQDNFSEDGTTRFTILLTWLNFIIASLLIGVHQVNSDFSPIPFWLVQIVHLFIVLIGSFGPKFIRKQFFEYQKKQPFECYKEMMKEVEKFPKDEHNKETLKKKIEKFDASVPEWSWLTLIRCSVFPDEKTNPQLKRIYDLVEPQKDADDYSLIAFVWSAYLLDNLNNSISRTVKYSDIEKILDFGNPKSLPFQPSAKTPKERDKVVQDFLKLDVESYTRNQETGVSRDWSINAQIFAQLTAIEIQKVWSQNQFEPELIASDKESFALSCSEYVWLSSSALRHKLHWLPVSNDTYIFDELDFKKLAELVSVLLEEAGQITNSSSAEEAISTPRLHALADWLKDAKDVRLIVS